MDKVNLSYITNLCVQQQGDAIWWTESNWQPHFCWTAKFVIDLEGNIIEVTHGSYTQEKTKSISNSLKYQAQADPKPGIEK